MDGEPVNLSKTMDRADLLRPGCQSVLSELFGLMRRMRGRGAAYTSWYGTLDDWPSTWDQVNRGQDYEAWPGNPDEIRVPWFLLWQIAWITANTAMKPGSRVLDMGGAGSLFSCYLASRGHEVHTIDLQEGLCRHAEKTASLMGWRLKAQRMDMAELAFPDSYFDHVFSVCVLEHLPVSGRGRCNAQVARVLRPGGTVAHTFDYANPQSFGRLDSPEDVRGQFIEPSNLDLRGKEFTDNGKRYLCPPQCFGFGRFVRFAARLRALVTGSVARRRALFGTLPYTIGSLFLEKPGEANRESR